MIQNEQSPFDLKSNYTCYNYKYKGVFYMKKLLSLILTGVIAVGMVGCRRDITKPLTDAEQTLVNEWSRIEEDLNSCNVSSIEDTIEDLDEQVELLEEEQDYFKKDDTEYKAIDELIDVFETANKVLEISVNFIKNPMSALVVGDTIEQQIEGYGDEIQDSLEKYKEYKKELGIVTNVDLSKIGNQEDNTKENKNEGTTDNSSNTTQSTNDNSSNASNEISASKSNNSSKENNTKTNTKNQQVDTNKDSDIYDNTEVNEVVDYCSICGCEIRTHDMYNWIDGKIACMDCFDNYESYSEEGDEGEAWHQNNEDTTDDSDDIDDSGEYPVDTTDAEDVTTYEDMEDCE